jgi:ribosomal protein S18 acetylase RimI-like enzyme
MEGIVLRFDCEGVDFAEAAQLIEGAPLGSREPERLERAFRNSARVCFAYEGPELVGTCRALTDGEYQAAVYDVCVRADRQGRGIGRAMLRALLDRLPPVTTILYASPGREPFYDGLGFRRMRTAMARFSNYEERRAAGYVD